MAETSPPTANGRADPRVAQTRALAFEATLQLIAENGVANASIERVAERSGVARSTIYRHWPDVTSLVLEAFAQWVNRRPSLEPSGDTAEELGDYLRDYARRLNDRAYATVVLALLEWSWRHPEFELAYSLAFDERNSRIAAILRAGEESGHLRADLDLCEAIGAVTAPFLYTRLVQHREISDEAVTQLHADLLRRYGAQG